MTNQQRQHLLAYLGYYVGTVDGDWGTLSRTACTSFQQDFGGIRVDGFGGPETDKALRHAVAYDMFKPEPEVVISKNETTTGTFWDEIEFFDRSEFACKCGGKYCNGFPAEPNETLVRTVDEIRRRLGVPVTISSGLRDSQWNRIQDGVSNSNHLGGDAADLISSASPARMKQVAEEVMGSTGGIGLYSWGIHVDTGKYSRWNG